MKLEHMDIIQILIQCTDLIDRDILIQTITTITQIFVQNGMVEILWII